MTKRALITGITGQDGSYLAEFLLKKGYQVHGVIRRASTFNTERIDGIYQDPHDDSPRLHLHYGDLTDSACLSSLVRTIGPDEVYNLGAQSHVRVSFEMPVYTCETVAMGALKLLEAVRDYQDSSGKQVRFYQASSSEMYGLVQEVPQRENTPFYPRSPYACGKVFAHQQTVNYREAYGIHASCGILFNHESPRRGETFVTRKITRAVGRIKMGLQDKVYLGNLSSLRDWGFAGDYVDAMWRMLQQDTPDDFVIATGRMISVQQFADLAFASVGLNSQDHIEIDPRYFRPTEVDLLIGDPSKAKKLLDWQAKIGLEELVHEMVSVALHNARLPDSAKMLAKF